MKTIKQPQQITRVYDEEEFKNIMEIARRERIVFIEEKKEGENGNQFIYITTEKKE